MNNAPQTEGSGYAGRRPLHASQEGWGLGPACVAKQS